MPVTSVTLSLPQEGRETTTIAPAAILIERMQSIDLSSFRRPAGAPIEYAFFPEGFDGEPQAIPQGVGRIVLRRLRVGAPARARAARHEAPRGVGRRQARAHHRHPLPLHDPGGALLDAMGEATVKAAGPVLTSYPGLYLDAAAERMKAMDRQGIDMEVLSINPIWYSLERDAAQKAIEIQNEALAEFSAAHSELSSLATASVSLQHPDLAVAHSKKAIKRQDCAAWRAGGSVAGCGIRQREVPSVLGEMRGAGHPRLYPPAAHPAAARPAEGQRPPQQLDRQPARYHHRALAPHLRAVRSTGFPWLKICAPRTAAATWARSAVLRPLAACTFLISATSAIVLKKKPTEYLRQIRST